MYCTRCGAEILEGASFCTSCGAPVTRKPKGDAPEPGENAASGQQRETDADRVADSVEGAEPVEAGEVSEQGEPTESAEDNSSDPAGSVSSVEHRKKTEGSAAATLESTEADAPDEAAAIVETPGQGQDQGQGQGREQNAADVTSVAEPAECNQEQEAVTTGAATPYALDQERGSGPSDASASKPKNRRPFYLAAIGVGLVLIAVLSYQLFFNRTGGDLVTYGQIEPIYIDSDTTITPKGSDGKELDSYDVTLFNDKGTAASARLSGAGGFSVKHLKKASKVKSGNYTVKIYDRTSKVEYTLPAKFAPKHKKVLSAVTVEVAKQEGSDENEDAKSSKGATTSDAVYSLYYQKCQEYLATYGEPSIVAGADGYDAITGLACVRLIDFDDDGTDELYLTVCTKSEGYLEESLTNISDAYSAEVWAYRNGGLKQVYKHAVTENPVIAGGRFAPLCQRSDRCILLESENDEGDSPDSAYRVDLTYKTLKGDSFVTQHHYVQTGENGGSEVSIDGKKSENDDLVAQIAYYQPSKFLHEFEGNDYSWARAAKTSLAATQKVLAKLEASGSANSSSGKKSKSSSDKGAKATNKEAHAAYQEVFKQYREAFAAGKDTFAEAFDGELSSSGYEQPTYWTDNQKRTKYPLVSGVSVYELFNDTEGSLDKIFYAYRDLNGDGVDELLLAVGTKYRDDGRSNSIFSVYGYIDGEVKGLLEESAYRAWASLRQDNVLCARGSAGWVCNEWYYQTFDGSKLNEIESLEQNSDATADQVVTTTYKKNGKVVESASDSTEGIHDSSKLANNQALIDKVEAMHPIDSSVVWKALSDSDAS